jgi:hypothetical protein
VRPDVAVLGDSSAGEEDLPGPENWNGSAVDDFGGPP